MEAHRVRMRKPTDRGSDVAIILPAGSILSHGDVVALSKDRMIVVEIEPEDVAVITVRPKDFRAAVLIGHIIGNLHRPVKVEGKKIMLPIQADDEIKFLKWQLSHVASGIRITKSKMVFEPEVESHEH